MNHLINNLITALNSLGSGFCDFAGSTFVQSGVLIVLLLFIDFLIRKRVRATLRYWLWMLIFVKLVLPPSLSFPTGLGYWRGEIMPAATPVMKQESIVMQHEAVGPPVLEDTPLPIDALQTTQPSQITSGPISPAMPVVSDTNTLTWQAVVFILWLVGVLILSTFLIQRILYVRGLVTQSELAEKRFAEMLNQCCEQLYIHRSVELHLSSSVSSPAVCGFFKPIVLIQKALIEKLPPDKLRTVLIHELCHIKRGDLWVNCLQSFLQIVYFYNPLLWLANAVIRRIREQAVDEMVLVTLGDGAKSYSNTLIDIAEMSFLKTSLSLRLIGVVESKKALEGRIRHMVNRPIPKSVKLGILGLMTVLIFGAVVLPMAKAQRHSTDNTLVVLDLDKDGLENEFEAELGTNPKSSDTDGDGLSDYDEYCKYRTDPTKSDSDRDGKPDGDWQERREYTYSIRAICEIRPPSNIEMINDLYQDAHPVEKKAALDDARVVEVLIFPFATAHVYAQPFPKKNLDKELREYIQPTASMNFSPEMTEKVGDIVRDAATDVEAIEKMLRWINNETSLVREMPHWEYLYIIDNKIAWHQSLGSPARDKQFLETNFLGDSMFKNKVHGTCSSTAILRGTMFRAAGLPTRLIQTLPLVTRYSEDPEPLADQLRMRTMAKGYDWGPGNGGANHTYNEVFLNNRWVRVDNSIGTGPFVGDKLFVKAWSAPSWNNLIEEWNDKRCFRALHVSDAYPKYEIALGKADIVIENKDLTVSKLPDGRYRAHLSIHNHGKTATPKFKVIFYVGDPDKKGRKVYSGYHNAGPIMPGGTWNEGTLPFDLNEYDTEIFVIVDPDNITDESDETNNKASTVVPGREPKESIEAETLSKQDTQKEKEKVATKSSGIDIKPTQFDIRLDKNRGTCSLGVLITNQSSLVLPRFKLRFYRGDPSDNLDEAGNEQEGWHGAGPIEPGKTWGERTYGFHLPDGQYEFSVFLDCDNSISEVDENNNRAELKVKIENGQIADKSVTCPSNAKNLKPDVQIETEKSDVLRVPSDKYPTIQSAVNAAKEGDKIVLDSSAMKHNVPEQNKLRVNTITSNQYETTLPNGVRVELVGLCEGPDTNDRQWWLPDGVKMPEPLFRASKRVPPFKSIPTQYIFLAKATGGEDLSLLMRILEGTGLSTRPASDGTALCYVRDPSPERSYHKDAFIKGPVEIGVASGQWLKARGINSNIQHPRSYLIGSHDEIIIQPPKPENSAPDMATTFRATANSHDYEYRLICTLKNGKIQEVMKPNFLHAQAIEANGLSRSKLAQMTFNIDQPFNQIVDYELLYRQFKYVRFNNVAFKPGLKTDVQVEEGKEMAESVKSMILLGMEVADVTPDIQKKYELYHPYGVVILNPGYGHERLGIGKLTEGLYFWMVGNKEIHNLREMIAEILQINANAKPEEGGSVGQGHEGFIRIVYGYRRGRGTNTQYLKPTKADIEELRQAGKVLGIPDEKLYYGKEKEMEAHIESSKKLSDFSKALLIYANDHDDKYPVNMEDVNSYLRNKRDLDWLVENIEYLGKGKSTINLPTSLLAYDKTLLKKKNREGTNVLYNGGRVAFEKAENLKELGIISKQKTDVQIEVEKSTEQSVGKKADVSFGPVIERIINDDGEENDWLIDFDSEKLFSHSINIDSEEEFLEWTAENGIDAMGETRNSSPGLYGFDMVVLPIKNEWWDLDSARSIVQYQELTMAKKGTPAIMSTIGVLPVTYEFKTREGGIGILQILEMQKDKKPQHFKIRYKMIKSSVSVRSNLKAEEDISQTKKVFLPDIDSNGLMLDLASGELVEVPKADTLEDISSAIDKLNKGDLIFDASSLILVRRATAGSLPETAEPFNTYRIGSRLPEIFNVKTKEGVEWTIEIHSMDKNGCQLRYFPVHPNHHISGIPLITMEHDFIRQILELVKQIEEKYPGQATHWPAGPGLYHVDAQGHVTVWCYQKLWHRSKDCAADEVGWGSSQLVNAMGMYYLPDGTPLQSRWRWRERVGGMTDIRVKLGRTVAEDEHVGLIHRHELPSDHDLYSRDGRERKIMLHSWNSLPQAIIVRIDRPMRLSGWWIGDIETDVKHFDDYDQLLITGPPVSNPAPMFVTVQPPNGT